MTTYEFTLPKLQLAALVAKARFQYAEEYDLRDVLGYRSFEAHERAAASELAVADLLGRFEWWEARATEFGFDRAEGDVGAFVDVRSGVRSTDRLIVRPHNSSRNRHVLVLCHAFRARARVVVAGWIQGSVAKTFPLQKLDPNGPPAHVVPRENLEPGLPPIFGDRP